MSVSGPTYRNYSFFYPYKTSREANPFSIIRIHLFLIQVKLTASYVNRADLRRAAIHLLQSMLALPLHFANMPIKVSFTVCWAGFGLKMLYCWQCSGPHDILVWIRIRIRGSMPLINVDPDPDPAIFVIDLRDANKKLI